MHRTVRWQVILRYTRAIAVTTCAKNADANKHLYSDSKIFERVAQQGKPYSMLDNEEKYVVDKAISKGIVKPKNVFFNKVVLKTIDCESHECIQETFCHIKDRNTMINDANKLDETTMNVPNKTYDEYKKEVRKHQSDELCKIRINLSIVIALSLFWSIIFKSTGDNFIANICLAIAVTALILGIVYWIVLERESNKKLKKINNYE